MAKKKNRPYYLKEKDISPLSVLDFLQSDIGRLTAIALYLDKSAEARETAWNALEKLGELVTAFAQGLKHANPEIRRTMVMNLGYTNDQRAVEPLIQALQDDDESMRRGAAESLGKLGDPRAVQPLIAALHDKDESVREAAAEALERVEAQKRSGGKSS